MTPHLFLALLLIGASPDRERSGGGIQIDVPLVEQVKERCGPAALEMVLRYYGADSAAWRESERAYDPALRGTLVTDLAAAARRAGYAADVATLGADSLIALLRAGVPPIVLYQNGRGPITVPHYGVITGWDEAKESFTIADGRPHLQVRRRGDLEKRWRAAGSLALIVRKTTGP